MNLDEWLRCGYNVAMASRKKPKALRKEEMLRIRVTDEQKQALTNAAQRAGLDVSNWIRSLALREAGALPKAPKG